ncbi:MAG: ech hydrogenase subunit [Methanofollis sp.]|nr:ech hydrogenase subunit [Methanofollis sp.]
MKEEEEPITTIAPDDLLDKVRAYDDAGFRLVQISCTKIEETFEITYCFDQDYRLDSLRLHVPIGTTIPSISGIYWGAFIYENEMHDFFGVEVAGINVDYKGNLLKTAKKYPFSNVTFRGEVTCRKK